MKPKSSLAAPVFTLLASAIFLLAGVVGCSSSSKTAMPFTWSLTGTVWTFTELNGQPVGGDRLPTLQLEPSGSRILASGGINTLTATYQASETGLTLTSPLASTRMAGSGRQMKTEDQFLQVLQSVTGYRLSGNRIELLAGEIVIARGQATPATPFPAP